MNIASTPDSPLPEPSIGERPARDLSGWPMLALTLALIVGGAVVVAVTAVKKGPDLDPAGITLLVAGGLLIAAGLLVGAGLTFVAPNEARVLQLLGASYSGTVRRDGLR